MWVSIANAWVLKGFLYANRVLKAAQVLMAMVWIGICQSPLSGENGQLAIGDGPIEAKNYRNDNGMSTPDE